ncbi:tyrosine-type recombinase/integrase [Ovoidimarina sediminis]|uniref:tyrosine-type recombinase/integrase n=1 Tax=Ovoidimarina sediminis TaxID=3079856 RepID=UPI00290DF48A|nr:tyrosine-type recombinase/integrase [Rhodophyticola sp. MJ-SS7]MDU8943891.1 tyrosine-type recombinase/integrase [Rhodophyticola sp. MJ-SS7]
MTELLPFEDPARRCLPLHAWPEPDQLAWEAALAPGDLLDGTIGPGHHWCPDTREKYGKGYGRWLTFVVGSGRFDPTEAPADRITRDAIASYVEELQHQVAPWTLWGRLAELLAVAKAISPERDWQWLRRIVGKLETRVVATRNKHIRLRPAAEILGWAIGHMDDLITNPPPRHGPTRFRDALMVALLIACPTMRLRNLTRIKIGSNLVPTSAGYELRFGAPEMKARKPVEIPVPDCLVPYLQHYLGVVRPQLLQGRDSDRLWITQYADPMRESNVYEGITRTTKRAFGRPINPHLFRDCAVTSVAVEDPKHIGIAPPILGHTDPRTTEQHYIQAQQIDAGRKLQASLRALRRKHPPRQDRSTARKDKP